MAKKGATQPPKTGPKSKSQGATGNSKRQQGEGRKSSEAAAKKAVEDKEDEWEDEESDADKQPAP
jgi:rRNA-processing protein EBP2